MLNSQFRSFTKLWQYFPGTFIISLQKKSVIFILIVTTTNRVSSFAETYDLIAHWKLDGTDNDITYDFFLIRKLP